MSERAIQQAAVLLFARRGYAATGIREIASAAGLNSATLYHYAPTKQDLLVGIMRSCLLELTCAATEATQTGRADHDLVRLVYSHVGISAANPLTARVTDREVRALDGAGRTEIMALRDGYEEHWTDLIARGRRSGDFHTDDPELTRLALLEMCNGVANWFRPGGRLSVPQVQRRFGDLACRVLAVSPVPADLLPGTAPPVTLPSEPEPSEPVPTEPPATRADTTPAPDTAQPPRPTSRPPSTAYPRARDPHSDDAALD